MRELSVSLITKTVRDLCIEANRVLPQDVCSRIYESIEEERSPLAKDILRDIADNIDQAKALALPICQDTGMAVVFAEVGQDVHLVDGDFEEAVNEGVRQGYLEGFLRCSVVKDPVRRGNTEDNTPAILHLKLVPGDRVKLMVAPKGFGSENMSTVQMLTPAATADDIIARVKGWISRVGSNPCPPMVVGVGIGGDFEYCALLAKKALCRESTQRNPDPFYREMEERMLEEINKLGIGPQGFGGTTTALYVNIEQYPTHIAGLPLAINVGCHVTRHAACIL